ncbi:hypothetical protein [Pedosphaera parvula]|uniref:Uncharacterized protein n=1 Tax=Pedosphaera parvula (strain Ellin514) TaxID=320771 RepID=B9XJC7_PEDPL|nr:hypothetical protein [Pedosphaera parvula]EEF59988.1 hypothetical protein Cflav_PD3047 [Pedosphaera parvula Ellin514]
MKLRTYFSTPGLERYPKRERLARWQATHNLLLREDAQYRQRHTSFLIILICLSCPLLAVYGYYFGIGSSSFAVNLAVIICFGGSIVYLSLRHLHFKNQCIGRYLQSNHAS